ncbi:MAG: right-handed parallel beta-helix repeat-containing protein [Acidobacteriota bacterium]
MRSNPCFSRTATLLVLTLTAAGQTIVEPTGDCGSIQQALDALPQEGGRIAMRSGTYLCTEPIVVDRDNVDVRGEGPATILRLADGANSPVLVIGQAIPVPSVTRRNIRLSDLMIHGNREKQPDECRGGPCTPNNPLRNNGITLRRVSDVVVERVTVVGARSGGLVTELGCLRVTVHGFTAANSQFDGLAAYETEDSVFARLHLVDNLAAGLSFDIRFHNNLISDVILLGNRKVGIFMRDARDNLFQGLQVRNSGEHGLFLAQVDADATKPAAGNTFTGGIVSGSLGAGLRVNDPSCVNNLVTGFQFVGNKDGCISEAAPGLAKTSGTICR